jgi:hypothetical protein
MGAETTGDDGRYVAADLDPARVRDRPDEEAMSMYGIMYARGERHEVRARVVVVDAAHNDVAHLDSLDCRLLGHGRGTGDEPPRPG